MNGSVPSGIVLLYSSQVTTRYGTNVTSGIAYSWDFGDGFASSTPTVQHAYSQAGSYQLTLQVQSNAGTASHTITLRVYQGRYSFTHDHNVDVCVLFLHMHTRTQLPWRLTSAAVV